jgi:bacterioferritin-associated ferredoxin
MAVTRCICHNVPFAEICRLVAEENLTFAQVVSKTRCTTGCGACGLYARVAVATGIHDLPVMTRDQLEEVLQRIAANQRPEPAAV